MRPVHVFVPARRLPDGTLVCPDYDDPDYPADLDRAFRAVGRRWEWIPVTESDIAEWVGAARTANAVVLNLCDADDSQGLPGVRVIHALDRERVPYSGADRFFYSLTTSRTAMKHRLRAGGVPQPDWTFLAGPEALPSDTAFPVILKPDVSGGSYGIEAASVVRDADAARRQLERLFSGSLHGRDFRRDGAVAEEFIDGPEFSVLVVGDWTDPEGLQAFPPVERFFADAWPAILTYAINWDRPDESSTPPVSEAPKTTVAPEARPQGPGFWHGKVASRHPHELQELARRAFVAVGGIGYGRVDLRACRRTGRLVVLEVNANCGLSSDPHSSTVGAILSLHNLAFGDLLQAILQRAEARNLQRPRRVRALQPSLGLNDKICWGYAEPAFLDDFSKAVLEAGTDLDFRPVWKNADLGAALDGLGATDAVFNLCDGDDRTYPGLSVVRDLAQRGGSYTGADAAFYEITTSKTHMKTVLAAHGVATAPWAVFAGDEARFFSEISERVGFPCLFKPDESAGSFGIRRDSRVTCAADLATRFADLRAAHDESQDLTAGWFAERFVEGREFTVLVSGDTRFPETVLVHTPLEYRFSEALPSDERFLFYARRYETDAPEGTPDRYRYMPAEAALDPELREVARRAYLGLGGRGYARVDLRRDARTGELLVLEVNANCGLGGDPTSSTMGAILSFGNETYAAFLNRAVGLAPLATRR